MTATTTEQRAQALLESTRSLWVCLEATSTADWQDAFKEQQARFAELKGASDIHATVNAELIDELRRVGARVLELAQNELDATHAEFSRIRGARSRIGRVGKHEPAALFVSRHA